MELRKLDRRVRPGIFILGFLIFFVSRANADWHDNLWISPGGRSYHYHHPLLNNDNWGLGVEYHYDDRFVVGGGVIRNSYRHVSGYATWAWLPWQFWNSVRIGATLGVASGYSTRTGLLAGILPTLMWETRWFGINLGMAPKDHPVFSAQLKFRLPSRPTHPAAPAKE